MQQDDEGESSVTELGLSVPVFMVFFVTGVMLVSLVALDDTSVGLETRGKSLQGLVEASDIVKRKVGEILREDSRLRAQRLAEEEAERAADRKRRIATLLSLICALIVLVVSLATSREHIGGVVCLVVAFVCYQSNVGPLGCIAVFLMAILLFFVGLRPWEAEEQEGDAIARDERAVRVERAARVERELEQTAQEQPAQERHVKDAPRDEANAFREWLNGGVTTVMTRQHQLESRGNKLPRDATNERLSELRREMGRQRLRVVELAEKLNHKRTYGVEDRDKYKRAYRLFKSAANAYEQELTSTENLLLDERPERNEALPFMERPDDVENQVDEDMKAFLNEIRQDEDNIRANRVELSVKMLKTTMEARNELDLDESTLDKIRDLLDDVNQLGIEVIELGRALSSKGSLGVGDKDAYDRARNRYIDEAETANLGLINLETLLSIQRKQEEETQALHDRVKSEVEAIENRGNSTAARIVALIEAARNELKSSEPTIKLLEDACDEMIAVGSEAMRLGNELLDEPTEDLVDEYEQAHVKYKEAVKLVENESINLQTLLSEARSAKNIRLFHADIIQGLKVLYEKQQTFGVQVFTTLEEAEATFGKDDPKTKRVSELFYEFNERREEAINLGEELMGKSVVTTEEMDKFNQAAQKFDDAGRLVDQEVNPLQNRLFYHRKRKEFQAGAARGAQEISDRINALGAKGRELREKKGLGESTLTGLYELYDKMAGLGGETIDLGEAISNKPTISEGDMAAYDQINADFLEAAKRVEGELMRLDPSLRHEYEPENPHPLDGLMTGFETVIEGGVGGVAKMFSLARGAWQNWGKPKEMSSDEWNSMMQLLAGAKKIEDKFTETNEFSGPDANKMLLSTSISHLRNAKSSAGGKRLSASNAVSAAEKARDEAALLLDRATNRNAPEEIQNQLKTTLAACETALATVKRVHSEAVSFVEALGVRLNELSSRTKKK